MKQSSFIPDFVETIPEHLDEGRLYISKRFRTASHLCACGCGSRVVTPLKPAKWELTVHRGQVSLHPSIGRWQLPCKSHYFIRENRVIWARPFTEEEMEAVLRRDARDLHDYYADRQSSDRKANLLIRIWRRIRRGRS